MRYFSIPLLFLTIGCGSMSDRTIHATAFVDHLNNMPSGKSSYLLWHNPNTGNKGDIKVTRSYLVKGIKCADYTSTVDIPEEYQDLVVLSAISKAATKLNMQGIKQVAEQDLNNKLNEVRNVYALDTQVKQVEEPHGVQTPRMN